MKDFQGKTAVITGAASGIGEAMAREAATRGMNVVLADIEAPRLEAVEADLRAHNVGVKSVVTDTSVRAQVGALADTAFGEFGNVHFLALNAGVAGAKGGTAWDTEAAEWDWVMGVNWHGVLYGVQAFVPRMIEKGEEGVIEATSSIMGLNTGTTSPYNVSKHAVARFMEGLYYDLQVANSKLQAILLCPGPIATEIVKSTRNKPADVPVTDSGGMGDRAEVFHKWLHKNGMPPAEVADMVFKAAEDGSFYVHTHPEYIHASFQRRAKGIVSEDKLPLELPPDFVTE
jgi:NAD(P)-dependent dehydrogenase (short-subunit alcohol dehydrogenase family)